MQTTYTTSNVKQMNIELIRAVIKTNPGNTKADIASMTGLSHATCNNLLNELVATGEVLELDKENKNGGRPSQRYQYNANFYNVLSLYIDNDSQKTSILYAVFNLIGEIIEEETLPCEDMDYQTVENIVSDVLKRCVNVKVIGIGIPGVVLKQRFINICDVPSLSNFPMADRLEKRFGIKTLLENDMNATAIGFYKKQEYEEETSIAVMTFIKDNFPGSGIIVDGRILHGHTHFAGEISYIPYGISRQEMEGMLGESRTTFPLIVKAITSMTALLNPETIILTGTLMKEHMLDEIKKQVEEVIAKEHIPHIYFKESIHNYYLRGLMTLAMNNQSL